MAPIVALLAGGGALLGQEAGLYGGRLGIALVACSTAFILSLLVRRRSRVVEERGSARTDAAIADFDRFSALSLELMVVAHAGGHVVRVNPAFERTLGYSVEELAARPFRDLVHPDDLASTEAARPAQARGEDVSRFENRCRAKDGSYRWLLWSVACAEDGLTYATARDVTERKKMQDELRASREQTLEAARLKSEFVATMSHEIRTPLNGVIGMTELLRDTPLNSAQVEYVDALAVSGEALLAVVDDVLDFSKMQAGFLELERTDFELRTAVEGACQMVAAEAHSKGLEIGHWVHGDVPLVVNGDRARLRQILLNLLSNGVKFTTAGEVTVRVWREERDLLQFSVSDTGRGIAGGDVSALFEAFAQADQSSTREHGGTGLGLAISRQLVELMGGEIGAKSREGGGSTFWFSAALSDVNGAQQSGPPHRGLRGVRTLIVDDNSSNRTILEHYFRDWGAACESADRPGTAIDVLERASREGDPFALALLDLNMPRMDGIGLVREIRERPALDELGIIVLTSGPPETGELKDARISMVLRKPAPQSAIYDAAASALSRTSPRVEREPVVEDVSAEPSGLVLVVEDNEINRMVVIALLNKRGLQAAVAHNGREAVAMAAEHDYDAILMDCLMPEVDGFQATRQIREDEGARHVPIVAMTALSMPGDRERCFAAGMDDYLSKPIRRTALEAVIDRWLPAELRTGAEGISSRDVTPPRAQQGVLDHATVTRLRDTLTPKSCQELLDIFDEQRQRCVMDIADAVGRGDREEVKRVAHLLKGSSASLGATSLGMCCERLELIDATQTPDVTELQLVELRSVAAEANDALRAQLV